MALSSQQIDLLARKEDTSATAERMMRETKDSLLFQFRWENLLMSSPVVLNCISACIIAAGSPDANVTFTPPRDGFKYLVDFGGQYGLRPNLVRCTDLGRFAFIQTESSMEKINMLSRQFYEIVDDALQILYSPQDARRMLRVQLDRLCRSSLECYEAARSIDEKLEQWLNHASELHLACIATQASNHDQLSVNEIGLAVTKASIDYREETGDEAKAVTRNLEKSLDAATEAYKKASDGFPTGWDILGERIVEQLADSLTTALNQAIPTLASNLSPVAKATEYANMAKGIIGQSDNNNATPDNGVVTASSATSPKDAADPAYNQVGRDLIYWGLINAIFIGVDGGIDWDKANGEAGKSTAFAAKMLGNSQQTFASLATSAEPSQQYKVALETVCKITAGIVAELDKAKDFTYSAPAKDSALVKGWQKDFLSAYAKAVELNTTAKSLPGSTANGVTEGVDLATQAAQIHAKTSQAQAVLESARNRLNIASAALTASKETYQKSTALLGEQQNKLSELNASLDRLQSSNLKMDAIKSILIHCITLAVKLKNEVTNLVRFFKAITTIIQFVAEKHFNPYIETIKVITNDGGDPGESYKLGPYTLTDLQQNSCFNSLITIRSYYSVFGDIASMWTQISRSSVFPGLRMVDEISSCDPSEDSSMIRRRANQLQEWSKQATDDISRKAKERQAKTRGAMESRVAEINEKTNRLPSAAPEISKAITSGAETAQRTAQQGLQTEADQSLLMKLLAM
ncbi:uncharacterized protein NECHADRAFT_43968 [Fusarium vanettenii 77-13-4]|uniref:Uncharacterized protein n=1 Tax=Fusarium vanettenii (strain ATCC MYA-4622 / CBS 123669 / FGSC 9596 / NRRL 45880 / 77-13-4) TaxID=660122 RepID=C7ZAE4_FUSV7|nr:uncharacterized protein NECHADRAFT_43968 [Fusarium vanettenii 77-13-4]EEU39662.1 hypothetical protein NECHADRAFT_43968 [Fusarium vanettenii 77-13-4]